MPTKAARQRVELIYRPIFKGPIEGYIVNFLRANYWRVEATMEYQDVMAEAFLVFHRVSVAYPEVTAKHFMALFKRSWVREFDDFATKDSKYRERMVLDGKDDESGAIAVEYEGDLNNDGIIGVMVRQAPKEIKEVLRLLVLAPVELLELASHSWRTGGKNCAAGNRHINLMLGRPEHYDSIGKVREYFTD